MTSKFNIVFDKEMLKQLKQVKKDVEAHITRCFDKLEELGPRAGDLIDSKLNIYELKMKKPPIRIYYCYERNENKLIIFKFEMKKSPEKQKSTISNIRKRISKT